MTIGLISAALLHPVFVPPREEGFLGEGGGAACFPNNS